MAKWDFSRRYCGGKLSGTLKRADRHDKRQLILDEASAQFNEHGFHDVRLEDIAEALGARKASISYHFQSKRALLEAAYLRTCKFLDQAIEGASRECYGKEKIGHWVRVVARMQSGAQTNAHAQLAILNDLNALEPESRHILETRIAKQLDVIEEFLAEAGPDSATRSAALLFWTLPSWIENWLSAIPARRHDAQIECLVTLLQQGVTSDATGFMLTSLPMRGGTNNLLFNREERARLKRDAFERAGIRRFNQQGYGGFSLNALADELGVSRGTFYYTFADKDALLEACAHRSHTRILEVMEQIDEASGPILPNIAAGLAKLYSEHASNLEPMLRACIYSSLSPSQEAIAEADWQGIAARLSRLLAECCEEGGCMNHGVEKMELILLSALRNIAVSQGLAGFPGGNPFGSAQPSDYFSPLLNGMRV